MNSPGVGLVVRYCTALYRATGSSLLSHDSVRLRILLKPNTGITYGGDASWWKGHEGNTAVFITQLVHVGGNTVKETAGQEFLLTTIIYFEHYYIILVQQSCWTLVRPVSFTLNIIILVQLWVAGEGLTIRVVISSTLSEVMEIVSYCTKNGRMSRKLVPGKHLSITKSCLTTLTTFKILYVG